jgi:hypothetical protein
MLCLLDGFDNVLIQPFMPSRSILAFIIRILLWLSRLDMLDRDVVLFSPLQQLAAHVFRSVINPNAFWSSQPLDDPAQAPDNALTADTAMRLAKLFGTTPEYWMNLQRAWDLAWARERVDVSEIEPIVAA